MKVKDEIRIKANISTNVLKGGTEILTWRKRKIDSWAKRRQKDIEQGIKKQKEDREALHRFRTKWNLILPNQQDQTKHKPRTPKPTNEQEKKRKPPEQSEQIKERRTENTGGDRTTIMETNNKKVNAAQGGEGNDKQEENNETEQYHNMNSIQLKTTDNDPNMQDEAQTETNNQSGENNQETKEKRSIHKQKKQKKEIRTTDKQKNKVRKNKKMMTDTGEETQVGSAMDERNSKCKQNITNREEDRQTHTKQIEAIRGIRIRKEGTRTKRKEKEQGKETRPRKKFKQSNITQYMDTNGKRKRKRNQNTHNVVDRVESEHGNNQRDTGKTQRDEPNGKTDLWDTDQRDTDQRDTDQCDVETKRKKETKEAIAKERTGIG